MWFWFGIRGTWKKLTGPHYQWQSAIFRWKRLSFLGNSDLLSQNWRRMKWIGLRCMWFWSKIRGTWKKLVGLHYKWTSVILRWRQLSFSGNSDLLCQHWGRMTWICSCCFAVLLKLHWRWLMEMARIWIVLGFYDQTETFGHFLAINWVYAIMKSEWNAWLWVH